jgi:hypothetical protein
MGRWSAALFLCLFSIACGAERVNGPLRQEAYLWQRHWTPAVRDSVRQARDFAGLVVLAAEVDFQGRAPRVIRIPLDGETLRARPVGAAVRVGVLPSLFADDPRLVWMLEGLVRDVAAEAKGKGIALSEIQIDYDCPASKLEDYHDLLPALRKAASPIPLTITALPSWMQRRRAFRKLIADADGYVLQLHSLAPPVGPDDEEIHLLEADTARGWVEKAVRFGRPFRAALPTYSYTAAFDADNNLLGLLAEGPLLSWSGAKVRTVRSDPTVMAGLIRGWTRDRPQALTGVLWYRLPVPGDRMNWSWSTLRAVTAGRVPQGAIRSSIREPEPGLVEIDLFNAGEAQTSWPSTVRIHWNGEAPIAADGLAVYRMMPAQKGEIRLESTATGLLRPGERRVVAWLRFAARTEVEVELP